MVAIKAIVALPKDQLDKQSDVEDLIELQAGDLGAFLLYAQSRAQSVDIRQIEDNRTDKQVGSPGNAVGSTSAVSKGAVPAVLGFAVENGALTQAVSGTTVTLRGNLVGWLDLVQNQGFIAAYQDDSPIVRQLRRVSYSFTLNTDTGTGADASASGLGGFSPDAIREQLGIPRSSSPATRCAWRSGTSGTRGRRSIAPPWRRCWIQRAWRSSTPSISWTPF